ncbi:hypothetical protein ACEZCY_13340 [Streptacidiphilus sp. N1-12]|uniref:HTH luxR-type domain-containing protein n=2 Tax=Streptacidiphilus alkalitolerans TaxID=3342712 RepID=A0ABV6V9H0_9ACTN
MSDESTSAEDQPLLTQGEIDLYRSLADLQTLDTAWRSIGSAQRQAFGYTAPEPPDLSPDDPSLQRLLALGLLAADPSQPGGYRLVEPVTLEPELVNDAKERALAKHQEAFAELAAAQQRAGVLAELQAAYAFGRRGDGESSREYVTGIEAINDVLERLVSGASREVLAAQPGQRSASSLKTSSGRDLAALDRGVAMRSLYMRTSVSNSETTRKIVEAATSRGAQYRVLDAPIPFLRMICIDRTWLVTEARDPEQAEHDPRTHVAQALVTRDPATVAAFIHNFERDWAQAQPFTLLPPAEQRSPIQEAVISALKTGSDHETIAKQLNVTSRTVTKHATAHRAALGAAPGFQHGYLTALSELPNQEEESPA